MRLYHQDSDLIQTINQAINYMEANLTKSIDISQIANQVGYSRFHFDRLFRSITGETPSAYLRQRRLSEAARVLIYSSQPILEIALDYQFSSQEAFTRAFRRHFRLTPNAYRRRRQLRRFQPRLHLKYRQLYRLQVNFTIVVGQPIHFRS